MKSTLRRLYDGEIYPAEQRPPLSESCRDALESQEQYERELLSTLTDEQKDAFEKYKDCALEIGIEDDFQAFATGFCLGLRLMGEAIQD